MTWWRKELGHQQPWYWHSYPRKYSNISTPEGLRLKQDSWYAGDTLTHFFYQKSLPKFMNSNFINIFPCDQLTTSQQWLTPSGRHQGTTWTNNGPVFHTYVHAPPGLNDLKGSSYCYQLQPALSTYEVDDTDDKRLKIDVTFSKTDITHNHLLLTLFVLYIKISQDH